MNAKAAHHEEECDPGMTIADRVKHEKCPRRVEVPEPSIPFKFIKAECNSQTVKQEDREDSQSSEAIKKGDMTVFGQGG